MVPSFCRFLLENLISGAPNKSRGWKMFLKKISGGGGTRILDLRVAGADSDILNVLA